MHSKSKHVDMNYHVIRDIIERKDIVVLNVQGLDNITDPLTNALPPKLFDKYMEEMRLRYHPD